MRRLFRLAIAMLPLALGAGGVGAQEPPRAAAATQHGGMPPGAAGGFRSREAMMQQQRGREAAPMRNDAQAMGTRHSPSMPAHDRSISDAVRRVQRTTGGHILGAEQVPYEGRNITRVKYMDDRGRVRYMDDPGTGQRGIPRRPDNDER